MQADLRLAGVRSLCALATVLGSTSLALAQFSTALPPRSGNEADTPTITITPAKTEPPAKVAAAVAPAPVAAPPATVTAPRVARPHWLSWPRLSSRSKAEDAGTQVTAPPTAEELQRVQSGEASMVEVAAAKIKADEAAAPARRAAIKYLASVKCHYFPEAEAALVAALRADRNETVRVDAAQALAECCCCTPKTMEALLIAVSGSERDGNPAEVSERVKSAANQALQRYAARGMAVPHPETLPPAALPTSKKSAPKEIELAGYNTLPLTVPAAAIANASLSGVALVPAPARSSAPAVTDAERRFAESAGTTGASRSTRPRSPSRLPEIRLRPIGVIPPMSEQ